MWCCFALFGKKAFLVSLVSTLCLDAGCCFAAYFIQHGSSEGNGQISMTHSALDVLVMFGLRLLLMALSGPIVILFWQRKAFPRSAEESRTSAAVVLQNEEGHEVRELSSDLRRPLRSSEEPETEPETSGAGALQDEESGGGTAGGASVLPAEESGVGAEGDDSSEEDTSARDFYEKKMEERQRMDGADFTRNIRLAVGFALTTCISIYSGLKCVVFHYEKDLEASEGAMLASILVFTNLEFFFLYNVVLESTKDEGELIRNLHMHPLYFATDLKSHYCDVCEEEMQPPHYEAFRCRTCDFDLCARCYRRKDKPGFKGAILARPEDQSLSTWGYFYRIVQMALGFWRLLVATLLCLVGAKILQLAAPNLQGQIFDSIIQYLQEKTDSDKNFRSVIIIYVIVNVLQGFFNGAQSLTTELVMAKISASVRDRLFTTIVRMDIGFFDAVHTGQLTSRLTNDTEGMIEPLQGLMNDLLANAIMLVGGVFMAFYTSWRLSILALTVVPPISASYRAYARWGRKLNHSIYQYLANSNQVATEALGNIRTVRAFSTESHESGRYREGVNAALRAGIKNAFVGASVSAFSSYVNLTTSVLILWWGGMVIFQTHGKDMSIGNLITFQLYWNMMNSAFLALGNVFNELIRASSAAERVCTLMDTKPEVDPDVGEDIDPRSIQGHLQLEGIRFRYKTRPEKEILQGIDLDLRPGSTTALVGKSGGGKSTLVHLLMRFYDPDVGRILLDGRDLKELKSCMVRQAVGFVAQDTQLFATSIECNIAYGIGRKYTTKELHDAAKAANAHEFIWEEDEKYETRVGEKGVMLSGGQKQRISIARCFLRRPKLLFLDEATSALDADNEKKVQDALERLIDEQATHTFTPGEMGIAYDDNYGIVHKVDPHGQAQAMGIKERNQIVKVGGLPYSKDVLARAQKGACDYQVTLKVGVGSTVVLIAHRLSTVKNSDQIAVLKNGKVEELGTHEQLKAKEGGIYAKLVERQMEREKDKLEEGEGQADQNQLGRQRKNGDSATDNVDDLMGDDGDDEDGDNR